MFVFAESLRFNQTREATAVNSPIFYLHYPAACQQLSEKRRKK